MYTYSYVCVCVHLCVSETMAMCINLFPSMSMSVCLSAPLSPSPFSPSPHFLLSSPSPPSLMCVWGICVCMCVWYMWDVCFCVGYSMCLCMCVCVCMHACVCMYVCIQACMLYLTQLIWWWQARASPRQAGGTDGGGVPNLHGHSPWLHAGLRLGCNAGTRSECCVLHCPK